MENIIPRRIYDFLKDYPPFKFIHMPELLDISAQIVVQYFEEGEKIFEQGDQPMEHFFVVNEGAVELWREEEANKVLVDVCDEGDVFGLRPLMATQTYALSAIAGEETLLYGIPTAKFSVILSRNARVNNYLASSFAAGIRNPFAKKNKGTIFHESDYKWDSEQSLVEVQSIESSKSPVICGPETSVQDAAIIMSDQNVGSIIIVNEQHHPVGITTDRDLRNKVVTGKFPLETPIRKIMSSPVKTVPPTLAVADVQIEMIKHNIHHLCITKNGKPNSKVMGVLSEHDLLVIQGNNPAVLIREIKRAANCQEMGLIREKAERLLKKYLHQEVSISYISDIITEINDVLIDKAVRMALSEMDAKGQQVPEASFCWLALGSEGREEQLLRTDQDNALIFADVPADQYEMVKVYYLRLAEKVTGILHECGFEYCPADMMASNPRWCLSLSEWKQQFDDWIFRPGPKEVMHSTIFFDYRPIFGDDSLAHQLTAAIYKSISKQEVFMAFLAKNAMQNPAPLSFFRNFIVERDGEHKDEFDIKARAMMPLVDAARVLVLEARQSGINNTLMRFHRLAELEPAKKELYQQAADAYEILMRLRALQGLKHNDSGRYFKIEELNKMQRLILRNSFKPISELQKMLSVRFQLNLMG